jgi:hypothetical protein
MSSPRTAIALVLILAATRTPLAIAQDPTDWIGKRVVLQFNSVLRDDMQVVDNPKLKATSKGNQRGSFWVYRVERVNGPWIWLKAEEASASGWILAAEVIPFDQAIDYYTNQIRANPADSSAYINRGSIWSDKKEYE